MSEGLACDRQALETRFQTNWKRAVKHSTEFEPVCQQENQATKSQQAFATQVSAYSESRRAKDGFAGIPHNVTADPQLSDEGFRLLAALESWAWNKPECRPSNRDIAIRAGWFTKSGEPSISKVKRVLVELEGAGGRRAYIRRVLVSNEGMSGRSKIELLRPLGVACQPKAQECPDTEIDGGSLKNDPGGQRFDHKEEALENTHREDSYRISSAGAHLPEPETPCSAHKEVNVSGGAPAELSASERISEVARLGVVLSRIPWFNSKGPGNNPEAIPHAKTLAGHIQVLLNDPPQWFGSLLDVAWTVHRGELAPSRVDNALADTLEEMAKGGLERPGARFVNKLESQRQDTEGETGIAPDYSDFANKPDPWDN